MPRITGTVLGFDGKPATGADVWAHTRNAQGRWGYPGSLKDRGAVASDETGADGRFTLSVPADEYRLFFTGRGAINTYLGQSLSAEDSRPVVVTTQDVAVPAERLLPAPRLKGTVRGPDGKPVPYPDVQVYESRGDGTWEETWYLAGEYCHDPDYDVQCSGKDGTYDLAVDPGVYRIVFGKRGFAARAYGGSRTVERGVTVDVSTDDVTGLDGKLAAATPVTVRPVNAATGAPMRMFQVVASTWTEGRWLETADERTGSGEVVAYVEPGLAHRFGVFLGQEGVYYGGGSSVETATDVPVGTRPITLEVPVPWGAGGRTTVPMARKPVVAGTAAVGRTLTVRPGDYGGRTLVTHQWFANGKAVKNGTGRTLTLVAGLRGKRITVEETAQVAFYTPRVTTTAATKPVAGRAIKVTRAPSIAGTATVGRTLTVRPPAAWPSAVTISYRWYADGKAIKAATRSRYKVSSGVRGKRITVRATLRASGFDPRTVTSGRTRAVTR